MTQLDSRGSESNGLVRQLGLFDSTMIVVGIVIGSGIFLTSGIMANYIPSAGLILLAWAVGGALTLTGALTYAELGAAMPEAGGQYVYMREAYGPLAGFLFGWLLFLIYISGGIAAMAVAFGEMMGSYFPFLSTQNELFSTDLNILNQSFSYTLTMGQVVGVVAIIILSTFNYLGLIFGKVIQNLFTLLKIGIIAAIVFMGFAVGKGISIDFSLNPEGVSFGTLIVGFGVAMVAVSWAFDGWNNVNFVAGEIKNPRRNLPLALFLGTFIITALYVLINYIYIYALPIGEIVGVVKIAEKAVTALLGGTTGALISAAVLVAVTGSLNGTILAGPRVYYAMARDKLFFSRVGHVHPRFRTPSFAIVVQALWSALLTISGTYEQLFIFTTFIGILFWTLGAAAVFVLRKKYPDLPRPYKTWGYPVVPLIFILASIGILINTMIEKPVEAFAGLGIMALGIPAYFYWKKKKDREIDN